MEATRQLRRQRLLTIVNGTTTRPADTGKGQDDWDDWDDLSKYQSDLPLEDNESQINLLQHSQQKIDHGNFVAIARRPDGQALPITRSIASGRRGMQIIRPPPIPQRQQ